jgi:hypothetical protein
LSRRKKITGTVILGLAATASVATIARAPYLVYYAAGTDRLCK